MNNIIVGNTSKVTAESLTGLEAYWVKLNSSGYVTRVTGVTDVPFGVVENGAGSGERADIAPLDPNSQTRAKVSADVAAGAILQIDASNPGQLVTQTNGPGVAQAEVACAAGGKAIVRPLLGKKATTVVALTGTAATDITAIHTALIKAGIVTIA